MYSLTSFRSDDFAFVSVGCSWLQNQFVGGLYITINAGTKLILSFERGVGSQPYHILYYRGRCLNIDAAELHVGELQGCAEGRCSIGKPCLVVKQLIVCQSIAHAVVGTEAELIGVVAVFNNGQLSTCNSLESRSS